MKRNRSEQQPTIGQAIAIIALISQLEPGIEVSVRVIPGEPPRDDFYRVRMTDDNGLVVSEQMLWKADVLALARERVKHMADPKRD